MHCGFVSQARWHAMVIHSPTAFSEAVTEFELESVHLDGDVLGAIEWAMAESGIVARRGAARRLRNARSYVRDHLLAWRSGGCV